MATEQLEMVHATHLGLVRTSNEDYFSALPAQGFAAVADGMGGHNAGEVASKLAIEAVIEELLPGDGPASSDSTENLLLVGQAVETANETVFRLSGEHPELYGMGTTLVVTLFRADLVFFAHVGDSRMYRYRDGSMQRLTRDHSLIQEIIDHGIFHNRAEARAAGVGENILTRSLGLAGTVDVDVGDSRVQSGDIYLLCSDGLTGQIGDNEILGILAHNEDTLQDRANDLLEAALDAGGRDNITLVLVRVP